MRLCYQVATPDVAIADSVTAYQGPLEKSFADLASFGYKGVELMTLNPSKLDWEFVKREAEKNDLKVVLVCTGEIFGQLGLSYTNPKAEIRAEAIARSKEIIDFAAYLGANINIGRVRGQYCAELTREETESYAVQAFRELADYAAPKNVMIALETVTIMQTNFINTLAEGAAMVDCVDRKNFRLMMDVFHLNLEEKNVIEAIRKYSSYNIHVHLADNNRRYPGHCGLDFEKIISTFKECGYDGAFCTEIFQIPSMEEAAKNAIAHLQPILGKVYGGGAK
ncbi:MAG: sugar phosphate isomerase/epimerase [Lachnospiraceae bacterium]|nr:sugar phosphate isomerase/epimerase [Lachnospiraceae bacterium]